MLSEIIQTEADKHCMISLTYEIKKKIKLMGRENRLVVERGGGAVR